MSDLELVYARKPDVRYRVVGDEAVVVRQDASEVIALNDVGARVLELIDAKNTLAQVLHILEGEYDASTETLSRDLEFFVDAMRDAGIVHEAEPAS